MTTDDHIRFFDVAAKIIVAISSTAVAVIGFVRWLLPWGNKYLIKRSVHKGLIAMHNLHESLTESVSTDTAQRAVIFTAHNGGGIPKPGSPFFSSPIHWARSPQAAKPLVEERFSDFIDLELDGSYILMLCHLIERGEMRFTTINEKDCMLKRIYTQSKVQDSVILYLGLQDKSLLYASFSRYDRAFTEDELTLLRLKAGRIKNILLSL